MTNRYGVAYPYTLSVGRLPASRRAGRSGRGEIRGRERWGSGESRSLTRGVGSVRRRAGYDAVVLDNALLMIDSTCAIGSLPCA
jgi:hypothetical protein